MSYRIPVHKNVLAASSTYFETMFNDNDLKAEVEMEYMDLEIVKSLIEYCYTGIMSKQGIAKINIIINVYTLMKFI